MRYGANVNTQDIHGDSPLHSSLLYHNTDNIELLLKYSANVEATNASGRKPIHIANDAESLDLLLKYGASVNSQDRIGNTPLHYAVVGKLVSGTIAQGDCYYFFDKHNIIGRYYIVLCSSQL